MIKLNITQLERIVEKEEISGEIKTIIGIFLIAINDWPTLIVDLEEYGLDDYELEVKKYINDETKKGNIEAAMGRIGYLQDSWQAESLFEILDVFQFYEGDISLKEIIDDIRRKLELQDGKKQFDG